MKKLFLVIAITCVSLLTVAAQSPGKVWLGGSLGISSYKPNGGDTYTNFLLLPEFGFVINEKISAGLSIGFQQYEYSSSSLVATNKMTGVTVAPFLRYSVLKGEIGNLFIDGGIGYSAYTESKSDDRFVSLEIGLKPGVALNVSEKFRLTAKYGFLGFRNYSDSFEAHEYGLNLDLSNVLLGVNFIF